MKQIQELKAFYVSKSNSDVICIKNEVHHPMIELSPVFKTNDMKIHWKDLENQTVNESHCIEAKLENCKNITVEGLVCNTSLMLINVNESEIKCAAQQIRLINCNNIILHVFTETGVYLQDSTGVTVKKLDGFIIEAENKYDSVYDFSSPYDSKKFRIL